MLIGYADISKKSENSIAEFFRGNKKAFSHYITKNSECFSEIITEDLAANLIKNCDESLVSNINYILLNKKLNQKEEIKIKKVKI